MRDAIWGEGEPTCSGEPLWGAPAVRPQDVKSFKVKNCARALRLVEKGIFFLKINKLKKLYLGENTIAIWVKTRVYPQKFWVKTRVYPQAWVKTRLFQIRVFTQVA